ncbi:MAG: alpha/beta hydrolase [Rubripirellula sp.]|nr:alpha/beta hydrolase [Rubripirellula sp.]
MTYFKRTTLASLLVLIWLVHPACSQESRSADTKTADTKTENGYKTHLDILYRDGDELTEYARSRCRLDVYHPTDGKPFSTVVWFHGGGLKGGNKSVPKELMDKKIAVVAVNYRLHPKVTSPVYIEDAAAAVAWTFKNIERFGGSPDRVFVSGHSAGGYLTSMVGLDKRWLAAHEIDANDIAGLIPYSGHTITHFTVRDERGISGKQPIVDDLAPLFHVRKDAPPLLLITGDREQELLGRYEENAYLWRMMQVIGHPDTKIFELDGYNHGGMAKPAHPLLLRFIRETKN